MFSFMFECVNSDIVDNDTAAFQLVSAELCESDMAWDDVIASTSMLPTPGGKSGFLSHLNVAIALEITKRTFGGKRKLMSANKVQKAFDKYREKLNGLYVRAVGDDYDGVITIGNADAPVLAHNKMLADFGSYPMAEGEKLYPFVFALVYGRTKSTLEVEAAIANMH